MKISPMIGNVCQDSSSFFNLYPILDRSPPLRLRYPPMKDHRRAFITELQEHYRSPVRDPLWKHIYVSPGIEALYHSSEMQELSRIRQLGPTHLLYPGAVHTRLNHSLGVYHLARLMMLTLLQEDSLDGCTPEGVRAFLAAALLHDLGHFPYTHSLKGLPLGEHEQLGAEIILESRNLRSILSDQVNTDSSLVAAIIDTSMPSPNPEIERYRALLSGPLDPDKLDYLNRDAYFCGVPYGIQDVDYIISKLRWDTGLDRPALDYAGLGALENLIFSKYLMYRYVYWHRTVRSATAMVKRGLYRGLMEGVIQPEELYRVDDHSLLSVCREKRFPPFRLIEEVQQRRLYRCIQEIPFRPEDPEHLRLEELSYRTRREEELTPKGIQDGVIIDIPEPISFEIDLPLLIPEDEAAPAHVFTPEVVRTMEQGLRMIRVFIREELHTRSSTIRLTGV